MTKHPSAPAQARLFKSALKSTIKVCAALTLGYGVYKTLSLFLGDGEPVTLLGLGGFFLISFVATFFLVYTIHQVDHNRSKT